MKRSPIRRKPRAERSAYANRPRDFSYMGRVKSLACCALDLGGCDGPIEADHAGRRGLSHKADDLTTIPLCRLHHRQRHDFSGPFKTWERDDMRAFLVGAIHRTMTDLGGQA